MNMQGYSHMGMTPEQRLEMSGCLEQMKDLKAIYEEKTKASQLRFDKNLPYLFAWMKKVLVWHEELIVNQHRLEEIRRKLGEKVEEDEDEDEEEDNE